MPPVIPDQTVHTAAARAASTGDESATIAVMNVYDGDFEWPAGARVAALRIIHLLPKTTAPPNQPRIGIADQTNARAVLGTVPVESDGSAYFEAPVGKPIYFQAVDAKYRLSEKIVGEFVRRNIPIEFVTKNVVPEQVVNLMKSQSDITPLFL